MATLFTLPPMTDKHITAQAPNRYNSVLTMGVRDRLEVKVAEMTINQGGRAKTVKVPKMFLGSREGPFLDLCIAAVGYNNLVDGQLYEGRTQENMERWSCPANFVFGYAPGNVMAKRPDIAEKQDETRDILKKLEKDMLTLAYTEKSILCKHKKGKTKTQYLANAKSLFWQGDENGKKDEGEYLCIKAKRTFLRNGKLNIPLFWERNGETYQKLTCFKHEPGASLAPKEYAYVPRGSLVIPRVQMYFYTTGMYYGVALRLDRDIRVVYINHAVTSQVILEQDDGKIDTEGEVNDRPVSPLTLTPAKKRDSPSKDGPRAKRPRTAQFSSKVLC